VFNLKKSLITIGIVVIVIGGVIGISTFVSDSEEIAALAQSEVIDVQKASQELSAITMNVMKSLNENYDGIGDILSEYQKSLTIKTSLDGTEASSKEIALEIQKSVNNVLKSEELDFVSEIDSYKIFIESKDGDIIN
jgi:flagellar basal body-associated protein FliL